MARPTLTREEFSLFVRNIIENECKKGNHQLEKIAESGSDMESTVVRWCTVCGSVTVDTDYDGRTNPGAVMKMRSPLITKVFS